MNVPLSAESARDVCEGTTVMPYLPPVPPMGTGFHRYVFSLYTHTKPLPLDHAHMGVATSSSGDEGKTSWLEERSFSSSQFLATHPVTPHTFCFFQAQWDKSVRHTYQHHLSEQQNQHSAQQDDFVFF